MCDLSYNLDFAWSGLTLDLNNLSQASVWCNFTELKIGTSCPHLFAVAPQIHTHTQQQRPTSTQHRMGIGTHNTVISALCSCHGQDPNLSSHALQTRGDNSPTPFPWLTWSAQLRNVWNPLSWCIKLSQHATTIGRTQLRFRNYECLVVAKHCMSRIYCAPSLVHQTFMDRFKANS